MVIYTDLIRIHNYFLKITQQQKIKRIKWRKFYQIEGITDYNFKVKVEELKQLLKNE